MAGRSKGCGNGPQYALSMTWLFSTLTCCRFLRNDWPRRFWRSVPGLAMTAGTLCWVIGPTISVSIVVGATSAVPLAVHTFVENFRLPIGIPMRTASSARMVTAEAPVSNNIDAGRPFTMTLKTK